MTKQVAYFGFRHMDIHSIINVAVKCSMEAGMMIFIMLCLLFIIISVIGFIRFRVTSPYSKGIFLAVVFSILAVVCLAQNYTQSLIQGAEDGISISNQVAYWLIGEDNWTVERFKEWFELSIYFTLFLIVIYPIVMIAEKRLNRKNV